MAEQGYRHYAGLTGSKIKTVGSDSSIYQYTNLETAIAAAQANDVIIIDDGTYSLTAANTINKNLTMIGRGNVTVNGGTSGISTRLFMLNKPAAGTAATYITFENISFANAHASGDVIEIDTDGGASGALYVTFKQCSLDAGASAVALDVDQTTNTVDLYVELYGRNGLTLDSCDFALTKAASHVYIDGYDMSATASTFALGTAAVASIYQFSNCIFGSAAITSGGDAAIIVNAINCMNETGHEIRALNYSDFDHTGNENIIGGTPYDTPVTLLVGASGSTYSYTTLAAAVAAATAGDAIYLEPGTHTITTDTTLTINKSLSVIGKGQVTVSGSVTDRMIMINKPGSGSTATNIYFENIQFTNSAASADVFECDDDGTGTGDLKVVWKNCGFTSSSGLALDIDQTTNTIDCYFYVLGDGSRAFDSCNIALSKAGSTFTIENYDLSGGATFTLGNGNVASVYNFRNIIFGSAAAVTGGAASIIMNFVNCLNESSNIPRALNLEDVDATGNEYIYPMMGSPSTLIVGTTGSIFPYTSLATAVAAADAGDIIILEPGTHTITTDTTLTLNKNITIEGRGRCVVTGSVADRMIMINKPASGTAATYITLKNLKLVNTNAGGDTIEIDNDAGGTGALYVDIIDCSLTSNTGVVLDLDQTTNTIDTYIYVKSNFSRDNVFGSCTLGLSKAASTCTFDNVDFGTGTCTLDAVDVASVYMWKDCMYQSNAFTATGAASIIENIWNCVVGTGAAAIAIAQVGDFDANAASENLFPAS